MAEKNMEPVQATENFSTDGLTLLERMNDDTDSDGDKESIEVYTSAQIARDGQMGWDTGHQWVLLVRKGEEVFPLFNDYVQHGGLQFWLASFNQDKIEGPESTDLQRKIYHAIIITGYVQNSTSNYTYVLKNPWYDYTQTITVTNASSVVYPDSGFTWVLTQIVY